jgi:hypothetical protein
MPNRNAVTWGTALSSPIGHCPGHTDAMVHRSSNRRRNMERTNEKPIELTMKELDTVSGGVMTPSTTTLPRNPFPNPILPGPTFPKGPTKL